MRIFIVFTIAYFATFAIFGCAHDPTKGVYRLPSLAPSDYRPDMDLEELKAAKNAFYEGKLEDAAEFALKAAAKDPYNPDALDIAAWSFDLLGEDDRAFEARLQRLRADLPGAELIVLESLSDGKTRSANRKIASVLTALLDKKPKEPIKGKVLVALAQIERKLGMLKLAETRYRQFDYIPAYWVLGAFDNDQNSGFNAPFPPETEFDLEKEYQGKRWKIKWRWIDTPDFDGRIHFINHIDPISWSLVYAYAVVESPSDMNATIRVSAENHIKIWFNGKPVLSDDSVRFASVDQFVLPVKLKRGKNYLLAKVAQRRGDWLIGARITRPDGSPIQGLKYPVKPQEAYPPVPAEKVIQLEEFEHARGIGLYPPQQEDDALMIFRRAYWLKMCGYRRQAIDAFEELNDIHPRFTAANFHLADVYRSEENLSKAVELYKSLLKQHKGKLARAELEMANYYRSQNRFDRSYEFISELVKRKPNYLKARQKLITYYLDKNFLETALKEAEKLYEEFSDAPKVVQQLARIYNRLGFADKARQKFEEALRLETTLNSSRRELITIAANQWRLEEALQLHKKKLELFKYQVNEYLDMAELYMRRENYEEALKITDIASEISPEYWKTYRIKGAIYLRTGKKEAAIEAFNQALVYRPNDVQLREYLEYLSPSEDEFIASYRTKRDFVEHLIAEARKKPQHTGEAAHILYDYGVSKVFPNGSSKEYVHRIIQIHGQSGRERYNQIAIPGSFSMKLYNALTYTPAGEELEATSIKTGAIHFPSLEAGTIIEVEYLYDRMSGGWMDEHFSASFYFQDTVPVNISRWVVSLPKDKKAAWASISDIVKASAQETEDALIYDFVAQNVPKIEEEAFRPPLFDLLARVDFSTIPDWNVLTRWMNTLVNDQTVINNEIRRKVKELTEGKTSKIEKLKAIYNFVVSDIRYLFADEGIMGKKPDLPANVFSNRFGDCKDKTLLMITMLKEVGINSHYAELRTRDKGKMPIEIPMAATNHAIVYVPAQEGIPFEMYIDGTATNHPHDVLPYGNQDVDIIVLDGKGHSIMRTPLMPPEKDNVSIEFTHIIDERGDATTEAVITARGAASAVYRKRFKEEATRRKRVEDWMNYYFKGAELKELNFEGIENIEEPIIWKMTFQTPSFARAEGDDMYIKVPNPTDMARTYGKTPRRFYPLDMGKTGIFENKHTFILPEGRQIAIEPMAADLKAGDFYEFTAAYSSDKNKFELKYIYKQKTIEIPVENYAQFREFCLSIEEVERREFKFVKIK